MSKEQRERHANIAEPHVLTSWKEVAIYLGKGVRTVQRWERELSLPVRRPYGSEKHVIVALPEELDKWMREKMVPRANGGGAATRLPATTNTSADRKRRLDGRHDQLERLQRLLRVMAERTETLHRTSAALVTRAAELTRDSNHRSRTRTTDARAEVARGGNSEAPQQQNAEVIPVRRGTGTTPK